ncbi:MAG: signal peptidase II [Candidatus Pelagibacter sp.]|nr:signal peptidase II [Candidatus Pelagibacter sp.]|tara:strand:+ start:606 stop:1079 length:474 start_codon:yes stop_codon:yes gene_type:complete
MKNKIIKCLIIFTLIFILDRVSKFLILNYVSTYGEIDIHVNNFLNLYLVWNTGIGFGLFSSNSILVYNLITALIFIINCVIIYIIYSEKNVKSYLFALILGGSVGNMFDRLYYSAVPDFIDLNFKGYHWFIFNVADIFITLGIICLILAELINYKKT